MSSLTIALFLCLYIGKIVPLGVYRWTHAQRRKLPCLAHSGCAALPGIGIWDLRLVVLLLLATHFRKSSHTRLIRGCFSFSQYFQAGIFYSLSPPPPHSLWLAPSPPLFGKFQHGTFVSILPTQRKRLHCRLVKGMFNLRTIRITENLVLLFSIVVK